MLYIFSLLYIILKGLAFVMQREIIIYLSHMNIVFLCLIILMIILLRKVLYYKKFYAYLPDHIMRYRFRSKKEYFYSIIILSIVFVSYVTVIIYLRISAINNPIDLTTLWNLLQVLYAKMSKGILCYNLIVLFMIIYVVLLVIKLIKKYINIHLTKMHFYLISFKKYINIHCYFRDHISVNAILVDRVVKYYDKIQNILCTIYLFGYYKNDAFLFQKEANIDIRLRKRTYLWSKNEVKIYDDFLEKYCYSIYTIRRAIQNVFYSLHFVILLSVTFYDMKYNNCILEHVALIIPLLFIYQIYIFIYQIYIFFSQFVEDKIVYNISAEINTLYYKNIIYLNDKLLMINNEIFQQSNYQQVIKDFLKYEEVEFYATRLAHE